MKVLVNGREPTDAAERVDDALLYVEGIYPTLSTALAFVTPTPVNLTTYTITITSEVEGVTAARSYSYTSDANATATEIVNGLVTAINDGAESNVAARNSGNTIVSLSSEVPGMAMDVEVNGNMTVELTDLTRFDRPNAYLRETGMRILVNLDPTAIDGVSYDGPTVFTYDGSEWVPDPAGSLENGRIVHLSDLGQSVIVKRSNGAGGDNGFAWMGPIRVDLLSAPEYYGMLVPSRGATILLPATDTSDPPSPFAGRKGLQICVVTYTEEVMGTFSFEEVVEACFRQLASRETLGDNPLVHISSTDGPTTAPKLGFLDAAQDPPVFTALATV